MPFHEQIKKDSKEVKVRTKSSQIVILPVQICSWDRSHFLKEIKATLSWSNFFRGCFQRYVNFSLQMLMPLQNAQDFLGGLKPFFKSWLAFVACVQQLLLSCRLCRWNFRQINLKYNCHWFLSDWCPCPLQSPKWIRFHRSDPFNTYLFNLFSEVQF